MQHKVRMTVLDKKLYPELQAQYCTDPEAGMCRCYHVGDEFLFERYGSVNDYWRLGINTLVRSSQPPERVAGGPVIPHCSEAWDGIGKFIYAGLQGGSIMSRWMKDERVMIASCSDGTRPVIFKIERMDYCVLYIEGIRCAGCRERLEAALKAVESVESVVFRESFTEVFLKGRIVPEGDLRAAVEGCGSYRVTRID